MLHVHLSVTAVNYRLRLDSLSKYVVYGIIHKVKILTWDCLPCCKKENESLSLYNIYGSDR